MSLDGKQHQNVKKTIINEIFGFSAKEKEAKAAKKEKEAADKAKKEQEDKDWSKWNYWTKKAMNPGGTADDNKKAKELEKLPHVAARVKKMRDSAGGGNARM